MRRMTPITAPPGEISLPDRWRLILGVKGCGGARARRAASALDQLYGDSAREGRGQRDDLAGGGTNAASPSAREWIDDVTGLFGKDICEEVIGEAAAAGRAAVLEHLDPQTVRPSIALLEQVLALRGALPERQLAQLRKLAHRITERLAQQLANRLRPALSGLSTARPTRRRSRRLDIARTLDTNLATAHRRSDGRIGLAPGAHLPHPGAPPHGLARDLRRRRVRLNGGIGHLQRLGRRHLRGAAGHRRALLGVQHGRHRSVESRR